MSTVVALAHRLSLPMLTPDANKSNTSRALTVQWWTIIAAFCVFRVVTRVADGYVRERHAPTWMRRERGIRDYGMWTKQGKNARVALERVASIASGLWQASEDQRHGLLEGEETGHEAAHYLYIRWVSSASRGLIYDCVHPTVTVCSVANIFITMSELMSIV